MRVLTIYAHHNPRSFCHAVLERFAEGLRDAGHESEVVDLYAIRFDPAFNSADAPDRVDDSMPDDVLARWHVKDSLLASARNPLRRMLVNRWMGDCDDRELVRKIHAAGPPRDVAEQQAKVARADALAFIAPVYFVGFPAILKGWIERVFSLGFASDMPLLTASGLMAVALIPYGMRIVRGGESTTLQRPPPAMPVQRHCCAKKSATWFSSVGRKATRSKPTGLAAASPATDGRAKVGCAMKAK